MSTSVTAATATPDAHYTDKGGHLVQFVGVSKGHAGMYAIRVVETGRLIDSTPANYPLFPVTEAELATRQKVAAVKGQPRDVLEPKLRDLDDDALDRLMVDDTRMWVTHAISAELDRRRITADAARDQRRADREAPVIPTDVIGLVPLAPQEPVVERLISAAAPIVIVEQGPIDIEEIPLVAEPGASASPLAIVAATVEVAREEMPARIAAENEVLMHGEPAAESTPEPVATERAPVVAKIRRPRNYEVKLGALGYPAEVYEAMTAEAMRAILEAPEPPRYVAPVVRRPGPARDARCPCCDRVIVDILGEAPTAVEVEGVWGCADCYDANKWPPPIEQLPRVSLAAALRLVAAAPLGDLVRWTYAEASGPAREEVLDAISARIAGASEEEHEAADTRRAVWDAGPGAADLVCPKCGAPVHWGCGADVGARGSACCSESGRATRMENAGTPSCDWSGSVVRLDDGSVALVVPEAERILGPVAPDLSAFAPCSPGEALAIQRSADAAYTEATAEPAPPEERTESRILRFLAERGVDLEGDDLLRFTQLTGSVRDCTIGLRGTDARMLPLVEAALAWATDHGAGPTVLAMLEKRVRQLRGAPTLEARRPLDVRRSVPGPSSPALDLSEAGTARVEAIRAQLAKLSAALPGYVAALESLAALRGLGIRLTLDADGAND